MQCEARADSVAHSRFRGGAASPLGGGVLVCLVLAAGLAPAQIPVGYYDSAQGKTGSELRQALHEIINDHVVIGYANATDALRVLDQDPANPANVVTIYSLTSIDKLNFGTPEGWNREHLWPNSYGLDSVEPAYSDLFNLRPELWGVNSARGNKLYDASDPLDAGYRSPAHELAPLTTRDSDSWEPPAAVRGDIARALFYMDVRYEGDRPNEVDLVLTENLTLISSSAAYMGNLNTLLSWHLADPVDEAEIQRNDAVYYLYQGNRNPFVDHPEYVTEVFGVAHAPEPASLLAVAVALAVLVTMRGAFKRRASPAAR